MGYVTVCAKRDGAKYVNGSNITAIRTLLPKRREHLTSMHECNSRDICYLGFFRSIALDFTEKSFFYQTIRSILIIRKHLGEVTFKLNQALLVQCYILYSISEIDFHRILICNLITEILYVKTQKYGNNKDWISDSIEKYKIPLNDH